MKKNNTCLKSPKRNKTRKRSLTIAWGRMPCGGLPTRPGLCTLQLDNAAAYPDCNRLCTIARAQLLHDVLDMNFHGLFGDE